MSYTIIDNAKVITPFQVLQNHSVVVKDSIIQQVAKTIEIDRTMASQIIDIEGCYIMPGFIDMHIHGGGGADFMEGTEASINDISTFHLKHGTTTMVLTTNCAPMDKICSVLDNFREVKRKYSISSILGVHLEGPFVSPDQMGALNADFAKPADPDDIERILGYKDIIVRVTAAPEIRGALELSQKLCKHGILMSVGHSNGTIKDMLNALESGYTHVSHFYSAMSTVRRINAYRISGVVESTYLHDEFSVEVIADGSHLPPSLLKLVYKIKGSARIVLVTDAVWAAGLPENRTVKGITGRDIIIEDGVAKLPDRSAFAGSTGTMDRLVKNMIELAEVPLSEAVKMASATPAKILGISNRKGTIHPGMDADLVVMDKDLNIRFVMLEGKII